MRCELGGLERDAFAAVDADRYAKLWGLASFGALFCPLLPLRLEVKALSLERADEESFRSSLLHTLSEAFYRSGLPAELDLTFSGELLAPRGPAPALAESAILMSGGGKDSAVAGELLKSLGVPFRWYKSKSPTSARELARICGDQPLIWAEPVREIERRGGFEKLRPGRLSRLRRLRRKHSIGRPWVSMMSTLVEACLVAEATGSRWVLSGNERSANEGNGVRVGDLEVNHQYTKSYAFEREFSAFLGRYLHPELRHASLLMPLYDLQIGRIFASHPEYFSAFRRCNCSNSWCCRCAKCAFVFLLLSAFVDEEEVSRIFGADLLADPELVKIFLDLCGQGRCKPFDCVGDRDESRLALYLAAKRRSAAPLHPELAAILPSDAEGELLQKRILQAYNDENGLPPEWNQKLRKMVSTLAPC